MTLMNRIKLVDFLSKTFEEQLDKVRSTRKLRELKVLEARTSAKKVTRSARRNKAKRGKKIKDPAKELMKTLKNVDAATLAKIKEMYNVG